MGCKPSKLGSIIMTLNGVIPCSGATKNSTIYLSTVSGQNLIVNEQYANTLGFTLNESHAVDLPFVISILTPSQTGQQSVDIILNFVGHAGISDPVINKDIIFNSNNQEISYYIGQLPQFGTTSIKSSTRYSYKLNKITIKNNMIEHFDIMSDNTDSISFDTACGRNGSFEMYLCLIIILILILYYLHLA